MFQDKNNCIEKINNNASMFLFEWSTRIATVNGIQTVSSQGKFISTPYTTHSRSYPGTYILHRVQLWWKRGLVTYKIRLLFSFSSIK